MKFKDPIAPKYGMGGGPWERWYAWRPVTTHDGYGVWLEWIERAYYGGGNSGYVEYRLTAPPVSNVGGDNG